jgi:Uma2 family endonuclease
MPTTLQSPPKPTLVPTESQPTAVVDDSAGPRLLTAADLAVIPNDLPSGAVKWELCDGRLTVMAPPGDVHGAVDANIVTELKLQGERAGHGKARTEVGIILRRNPDCVLGPDATFIGNASLPLRLSAEGYLETIPDLVVEVRSKNDTTRELEHKAGEYLAAGVKLVWVVDPLRSIVTVFRAGQSPQTLQPTDALTAEGIIPDFKLTVADALKT